MIRTESVGADMLCCFSLLLILFPGYLAGPSGNHSTEKAFHFNPAHGFQASSQQDRDKAVARQQFNKNFREIQILGQGLLREHEAKRLNAKRLAKDVRSINKSAKTLRSLIALGDLAVETKIDRVINTPEDFDESIRKLAKLIWDFAHNPVHQNSKVFNTDHAERAQTDLLTIINLSKVIEERARDYVFSSTLAQ
jgi:hypothetical protein